MRDLATALAVAKIRADFARYEDGEMDSREVDAFLCAAPEAIRTLLEALR